MQCVMSLKCFKCQYVIFASSSVFPPFYTRGWLKPLAGVKALLTTLFATILLPRVNAIQGFVGRSSVDTAK